LAASASLTTSVEFGNVNVFSGGNAAMGHDPQRQKKSRSPALSDTRSVLSFPKRDIGTQTDDLGTSHSIALRWEG
jgi:hypothetical protein